MGDNRSSEKRIWHMGGQEIPVRSGDMDVLATGQGRNGSRAEVPNREVNNSEILPKRSKP